MAALCIVLTAAAFAAPTDAPEADLATQPDPRLKIATAIEDGIRLLEANEHKQFIETYAHPDDLKKILDDKSIDELVKQFKGRNADQLLKVLQLIRRKMPKTSEDGEKAVFKLDGDVLPSKEIRFEKSGGLWYIRN